MPAPNAPEPHQRTQEQSIKARKHQLFDSDDDAALGPRRTFAECLRDTPAAPLAPAVRAGLWAVGVVVVLLLLAALIRSGTRKPTPRPAPSARIEAEDRATTSA